MVDWRCDWIGPGVALLLASQGHAVTLAVDGYMPGQRIQQYVRDDLLASLHRAHVQIVPTVRLFGADDGTVYLQHTLSEEAVLVEGVGLAGPGAWPRAGRRPAPRPAGLRRRGRGDR